MDIHNKLVSQTYTAARSAAAPMPGTTEPAANPVASSVSAFEEVLASAEQTARAAMTGAWLRPVPKASRRRSPAIPSAAGSMR